MTRASFNRLEVTVSKGLPRSLARGGAKSLLRKHLVSLKNVEVTVSATGSAVGFGTAVIGDLPEGNLLVLGAVAYIQATSADADIGATWDGDYSIGSAPTADVTLSGAEVDIIPSSAFGAASAKASPVARGANATAVMLNNTDGSLELNLNFLVDAANIADDSSAVFVVNGVVEIVYGVMLDD